MAIQFGIATMSIGATPVGILQNVNFEFSFDTAKLYSGARIYPVDVRTHTGAITGSAEFADINADVIAKILGGTRSGAQVTLTDTDFPSTFQITVEVITDSIAFNVTFVKARSTKFSLPFVRDGHVIPSFDFECEAEEGTGEVAIIDCGDET